MKVYSPPSSFLLSWGQAGDDDGEYGEYDGEEEASFECGYYNDYGEFIQYECDSEGYWDEAGVYHLFKEIDNVVYEDLNPEDIAPLPTEAPPSYNDSIKNPLVCEWSDQIGSILIAF